MTTEALSQRERNKLEKRTRILAVAKHIIATEGIDALTMRHLADVAELSSRTPYNLFGSKTEILVAIMFENLQVLSTLEVGEPDEVALRLLFDRLGSMLAMPEEEEAFHRSVHWAIMRSDDVQSKQQGRLALNRLIERPLQLALEAGELTPECDCEFLTQHLAILLAAIVGMWADSQLTLEEAVGHVRVSWLNALAPYTRGAARSWVQRQLAGISSGSPTHLPVSLA